MPPVRCSSSSSGRILYRWEDENFSSADSGNKKRENNNHSSGQDDNGGKGNQNNNANNGNNGDNYNNGNYSGGDGGNSSQNQSSTCSTGSSSSATESPTSSSITITPTQTFFSNVASTRSTSSTFIPTSTFSSSTSFDIPTPSPSLSSSSYSIPLSPISTISGPSTNDALGLSTTPGDIHRILPLGSIVAIILGCLFCITITLVIYVITRPRFGSLGRLWTKSTVMAPTSIMSFEPKEHGYGSSDIYRSSDLYMSDDFLRPESRSHLLNHSQFPASSSQGGHDSVDPSLHVVEPGSAPAGPPEFPDDYPIQSYVVPSPSSVPASRFSSGSASDTREPSPNFRSITRILSILEGYPFEHVERGQTSDNALKYPRSVHETVE